MPDWLIATTSKGWTSNDIALRWLKEIFLPETVRKLGNSRIAPRILVLDGHGSHVTGDFMWQCDGVVPYEVGFFFQEQGCANVQKTIR
jgi:hypothetical protein